MSARLLVPRELTRDEAALEARARFYLDEMAAQFGVGASSLGRRYGRRYGDRYGARYGVGQAGTPSSAPPTTPPPRTGGGGGCGSGGGGGAFVDSGCTAGTGRRVKYADGYSCEVRPRKCECQVVGTNTLLTNGIASAAFGPLTIDSGDADFFIPYYMFIVALQTGATPTLSTQGAVLPVLLQQSRSGQEPNMRRASVTDQSVGVNTLVYGQFKDLECVDWRKFSSTNNQQLTLTFYNPNEVAVHIFVDLWGIPGVSGGA